MRTIRLLFAQMRYVNKAFWRNPASAFFTFAFPLMFLVIFTALLGHGLLRLDGRIVHQSSYYVAAMAAFAVISSSYTNVAMTMTFQRDAGVLKRTHGTPLPTISYLGARVVHSLFVGILLVVITAAFGRLAYAAEIPSGVTLIRFLVMVLVGSMSFCALAFAITSVVPNADAAPAIVNASILPLLFLSGIFIPLGDHAPTWVVWVARIFPVRHFASGLQAGFLGTAFSWTDVIVVAAWGLGGLLVAMRFFFLGAPLDLVSYKVDPLQVWSYSLLDGGGVAGESFEGLFGRWNTRTTAEKAMGAMTTRRNSTVPSHPKPAETSRDRLAKVFN